MTNFWPSDLELNDTRSPKEILKAAQEDWDTGSDGLMALILQETTSQSGNTMIIVHAKHLPSNCTSTLFSVVHRPHHPYPVTIQPEDENLPNILKRSYYAPGLLEALETMKDFADPLDRKGQTVSNQWVSDTPSEFRRKLINVFNLGLIKSRISNLVSDVSVDTNGVSQEDAVAG